MLSGFGGGKSDAGVDGAGGAAEVVGGGEGEQPASASARQRAATRFLGRVGIMANLFLMGGLGVDNWLRLVIWMAIGLAIYFSYSRKKSHLGQTVSSLRH